MRARLAAVAVAGSLLAALAGCGGDGGDGGGGSNRNPPAVKRNFTTACEKSSGGDKQGCACALDKIEAKLTYDEFKKEDRAIRAGGRPSRAVRGAITACVK